MIHVLNKRDMQALDRYMIEKCRIPSALLMENAAFGITTAVSGRFGTDTRIVAVCGAGNNGGDGFAAARQLEAKGYHVTVCLVGRTAELKGDAAMNAAFFGPRIIEITDENTAKEQLSGLSGCVLIDAVFGVGLSREVTGLYAAVLTLINQSGAYVVACDIASGIDADTGAVRGAAVKADETVTFQCAKPGHLLFPGRAYTGALTVKEIGAAHGFSQGYMGWADTITLQKRRKDTHKGSFGHLACVTGSRGMTGAGVMCVRAALRAGAGLVTAGVPESVQGLFAQSSPESLTFALDDFSGGLSESCVGGLDRLMAGKTALAAGPGLSLGGGAAAAVRHLVTHYDIRKVFDADALTIIARDLNVLERKTGDIVLTPHPKEFSRLCGVPLDMILQDPLEYAREFALKYGVTLLLKGATTIVTDGARTVFVTAGSPGMARGGSGDVLTGVIGGLMCGGREGGKSAFEAAVTGAYICGKAGEAAAAQLGELSMTAMDTLSHIAEVTKAMTREEDI